MQVDLSESWYIGEVPIPTRLVLAPMAGITDSIVRILARRYDCGMVTTEMVAFEWLRTVEHPAFKEVLGLVK